MDEQTYQSCGSVIKICKTWQRKPANGKNVFGKRKRDKYFGLCLFLNIFDVIKSFTELKKIGIEDITLLLSFS